MNYESYEPEQDEYYDAACSAAFTLMFNEGGVQDENLQEHSEFADSCLLAS